VKAALVRTQMEGKISQEAQENVKAALLRTQQQENANEIRLSSLKASLGVVDQSTQPTSLTLPEDPLDGAFEKTWAAAEKAGAILQQIGQPAQQLPECTQQLPECAADDMLLMSPRTQRIAERNANKLSFLRTQILAPTGTPLPSAQLAAAPYTVDSTEHQVAAPVRPAPAVAPVAAVAPSSEWSGFSSMGPPRVQETQQPAPQLSVSSLSMRDNTAQSHLHEPATESAMVPVESVQCTRLQKLQQRTREDMQEEMQQILQTNDHDQVLRAVLASPISSFFAARAQVKQERHATNQTGSSGKPNHLQCSQNNADVLNRYQSLINPAARAQRVQHQVDQRAQLQQQASMQQQAQQQMQDQKQREYMRQQEAEKHMQDLYTQQDRVQQQQQQIPSHRQLSPQQSWAQPRMDPAPPMQPVNSQPYPMQPPYPTQIYEREVPVWAGVMQERHAMHEEAMNISANRPPPQHEMFAAAPAPAPAGESLVQQLQNRRNASGRNNGTMRQQIASEAMFNEMDVNGDGVIDRHEFAAAMQPEVDNSLRSQLLHSTSDRSAHADEHMHHMNVLRQHH